ETEHYRSLLDGFGSTLFTGHETTSDHGRLLASTSPKDDEGYYELFFDRTPFYPEGGGQVGDTGVVVGDSSEFEIVDTSYVAGSLVRHRAKLTRGIPITGELMELRVDKTRREAIRRNHTGTHLLHWALRKVLGDHVRQQGSLVAPDRLRFDFTHFSPMSAEEKREVEALVNAEIIANVGVKTDLMAKDEAMKKGAMAFFGDKYSDVVRVVRAGTSSIELCGGTHVESLGAIGLCLIVSEASIGSNTRRIEAVTGNAALERVWGFEDIIADAAFKLKVSPSEVSEKIEQLRTKERELQDQLKGLNKERLAKTAASAVVTAGYGVLRQDGLSPEDLRELALMIRSRSGTKVIVVAGSPGEGRASIVCAVGKDTGLIASEIIKDAAGKLGGGVGRQIEVATAGGKNVDLLDEVLLEIEGTLRSTIGNK
ncbi:MAG: alanine--tRNA ligase, partial [Acidimicrobiaceae bacterium]|nr:alanine--tRNA ligase [Acidimicrobiaceae bacterium]